MIDMKQAQPEKPIAFFDFQGHGFFWAPDVVMGPIPVAAKIEPMPLYSAPMEKLGPRR